MTLPFGKKAFLFAYPGLVICAAWVGVPVLVSKTVKSYGPDKSEVVAATQSPGHALFVKNCAYCHGPDGQGNGPAELEPKARYFGWEQFKFVTTQNRIPTDGDLMAVLKRGIPGSAMPSFADLSDDELKLLVEEIRVLSRAGLAAKIAKKLADDYDPGEHQQILAKQAEPGESLVIPATFADATPESIANGKKLYGLRCAQCHGAGGKGDGQQEIKTEEDRPIRPRDLTMGIYRGGGTKADLYARIVLGIGGKPMPTNADLPTKDIQDLVNFVQSLAK